MSDDEHRIMGVVAEDATDKASPEDVEDMLKEMRQFVNEHDSNPSQRNFDDWSEAHSGTLYTTYFGGWNNAVESVGGDPNTETLPVSKKEALKALDKAAEQRIEYKVDGEEKVSPEGEAPAFSRIRHINKVDNLTHWIFSEKFDRTYTELAVERGYDTVGEPSAAECFKEYDWDEVKETLKHAINQEVYCRALDEYSPPGEIPPGRYIDNHTDLPPPRTLRDRYGPREDWPEEVGLEKDLDANDVDVDPSDFGL